MKLIRVSVGQFCGGYEIMNAKVIRAAPFLLKAGIFGMNEIDAIKAVRKQYPAAKIEVVE